MNYSEIPAARATAMDGGSWGNAGAIAEMCRHFSSTDVFEKWGKEKITFLLFAGQDALMLRAQGCTGAAVFWEIQDRLIQSFINFRAL